jgi:hypothetical protein
MNKKSAVKLSLLAPMLCAALALSASAQAQSGHRLYGHIAALPDGGYVGRLEEQDKGSKPDEWVKGGTPTVDFSYDSYTKPQISKVTWVYLTGATCESVGTNFLSGDHTNVDMCQYMKAGDYYLVVKNAKTNKTFYNSILSPGFDEAHISE